ncbi:MAG: hypothetical protein NZM28_09670 [Fimbriimonadales bacterium]|nr:hypothetical protein [Fimbriimonadales bacterium]
MALIVVSVPSGLDKTIHATPCLGETPKPLRRRDADATKQDFLNSL